MKKQGFTLIELMVVIVIMGILAAVAVPKLFGMIAKSKASELGPAAGEYIKLQDAYISEASTQLGNWTKIGYVMDDTNNFDYSEPDATSFATLNTTTISAFSGKVGWQAKNLANLNDCAKDGTWGITITDNNSATTPVTYGAKISSQNCYMLAPSFDQLTKGNVTISGS